jgi:hypothetical protein
MKSKLFILDYKDLFNGPLIAFLVDDLWDHKDNLKQEQFVTDPTLKPVVITGISAALGKTNVLDHLCLRS